MSEKILETKKNGMLVMLLILLGYIIAIAALVADVIAGVPGIPGAAVMVVAILYMIVGLFLLPGLKVLKPQEALVLTLFGDYVGTLKGEGFYWVNPFCTAVNPAAGTRLGQSGDVQRSVAKVENTNQQVQVNMEINSKKISLKRMTLNNSRQKINDCLGNPVEIGIAVIWQVKDTAKAVFNVDNYKEYLSLQCDSALRPMMWPPMWTPPATASRMTAACGVPVKWWPTGSRTKSSRRWRMRAWKLWTPGLLTWPMPLRLQR